VLLSNRGQGIRGVLPPVVARRTLRKSGWGSYCGSGPGGWPWRQMNNPRLPWARLFAYAVVLMLGAVAVAWWWFLAWLIWRVI
jgi:hypothetical protein